MKNIPVRNRDKPTNQGRTRVELAAEIRRRAYQLYEQRGQAEGHALEDWERAEIEVLQPDQTGCSVTNKSGPRSLS
ncbi:MAG: DUF2934 domain-containing protein [Terriglobales bacterium]|nr:DUF2934 domain-containing protein [Terriglobales bacterium]